MALIIVGVILILGGLGAGIYGVVMLTNPLYQLAAALGGSNPGLIYAIVGGVALVVGIVLAIVGAKKKKNG